MHVTRSDKAQNNMLEQIPSVKSFKVRFNIAALSGSWSDKVIIRSSKAYNIEYKTFQLRSFSDSEQ